MGRRRTRLSFTAWSGQTLDEGSAFTGQSKESKKIEVMPKLAKRKCHKENNLPVAKAKEKIESISNSLIALNSDTFGGGRFNDCGAEET